ncbi:MAG TPA: DUF1634 domain-containing protein [Desulfosporosinus sp.]|nr:DUF1634 domain-containing protein [Desulfosporosinus sp.]
MSTQSQLESINLRSYTSKQNDVPAKVQANVEVSPEQDRYASILLVCSWAGIIIMVISFLLYMGGFFNPLIKPSDMPLYWGLNVHQYLEVTHAPSGWNWLPLINHSDYLNLVGLAFLGSVSVLGYISLLIGYLRKKDFPYIIMVTMEIFVIVSAASGIFHISE